MQARPHVGKETFSFPVIFKASDRIIVLKKDIY